MKRKTVYYLAALCTIIATVIAVLSYIGYSPFRQTKSTIDLSTEIPKESSAQASISHLSFGPEWIELERTVLVLNGRCSITYIYFSERMENGAGVQRASGTLEIKSPEYVRFGDISGSHMMGPTGHEARFSLSPGDIGKFMLSQQEFSVWVLELDSGRARVVIKNE